MTLFGSVGTKNTCISNLQKVLHVYNPIMAIHTDIWLNKSVEKGIAWERKEQKTKEEGNVGMSKTHNRNTTNKPYIKPTKKKMYKQKQGQKLSRSLAANPLVNIKHTKYYTKLKLNLRKN